MPCYLLLFDGNRLNSLDYQKLLTICSRRRRARSLSYFFKIDRYTCVAGELLAKYLSIKYFYKKRVNLSCINLLKNRLGKPYLYMAPGEIVNCSLSYSRGIVAVCLSSSNVGLDIQFRSGVLDNSSYVFNKKERAANVAHPANKYKYWNMKEAVSKLLGKGMLINFHDLNFRFLNQVLFSYRDRIYVRRYPQLLSHFEVCVASYLKHPHVRIVNCDVVQFRRFFLSYYKSR